MIKQFKAIGTRGSWFAEVDGERLPCVHMHWAKPWPSYHDPHHYPEHEQAQEVFEAIKQNGRVVLTTDDATFGDDGEPVAFRRSGYVAVFQVEDLSWEGTNLKFRFGPRLKELK